MNPMLPAKLASAALLAAALVPALAWGKATDRNQPTDIVSDSNNCSFADNGKCRFNGNVVITQGTLEIHADTADLIRKDGEIERVLLSGKQATLQGLLEGEVLPELRAPLPAWMHDAQEQGMADMQRLTAARAG